MLVHCCRGSVRSERRREVYKILLFGCRSSCIYSLGPTIPIEYVKKRNGLQSVLKSIVTGIEMKRFGKKEESGRVVTAIKEGSVTPATQRSSVWVGLGVVATTVLSVLNIIAYTLSQDNIIPIVPNTIFPIVLIINILSFFT